MKLYSKFIVRRTDGWDRPDAKYFVLNYASDHHARVALLAYAASIAGGDAEFAADLRAEVAASGGLMSTPNRWSTAESVLFLDELPQQVRAVREARGLSLREAAAEIGCAHNVVWKVEHGANVGIETAKVFLSWLDHEPSEAP